MRISHLIDYWIGSEVAVPVYHHKDFLQKGTAYNLVIIDFTTAEWPKDHYCYLIISSLTCMQLQLSDLCSYLGCYIK